VKSFNGTQTLQTLGYKIPAGTSSMFQVGYYSEANTNGPWTIWAVVGNPLADGQTGTFDTKNTSSVTVSVDKTSGVNGEKAWVTVNVKSSGTEFVGELVTIVSNAGGTTNYMPIWIAGQ
jgi:hypothetical protein